PGGPGPWVGGGVGQAFGNKGPPGRVLLPRGGGESGDATAADLPATADSSELLNEAPPTDPSDVLPTGAHEAIGVGTAGDAGERLLPGAGAMTQGNGLKTGPGGGTASTSVFGIPAEGYRFVYVFDRSASMGGSGRSTLAAAKLELVKSLASLGSNHQFQIIFYNESPSILNIAGTNRLVFGTDQNKELARRFVGGITADGATRHEEALLLALRLKPDVIFFLTDADEPGLSSAQLGRIHRLCEGVTTINTIEFGLGPALDGENFLARLARENGGQYAYFDVSRLDRRQ
ncbi:MAG: hypothetical protein JNG90_09355, partial [Planctomycetaceae bacterium]|nr:hypothetical protein [Planctomycetaceae bacterium]